MDEMFEKATREKIRFPSTRGEIAVEDLWAVPFESSDGFDIDTIAKRISKSLKESSEESFVKKPTKSNSLLELKLKIVKYIIDVRLDELESRKSAADKKARKTKLLGILGKKQDEELEGMSPEDIQKEIDALE